MLPFNRHQMVRKGLVRTGVDADGNCFWHAYLYCIDATTIRRLPPAERLNRVMAVKQRASDRFQLEDLMHLVDADLVQDGVTLLERVRPLNLENREIWCLADLPLPKTTVPGWDRFLTERLQKVKNDLRQHRAWMYDSLIHWFMHKSQLAIYMLSEATGRFITHYNIPKSAKHAIMMYHLGNHFESLGIYDGEHITRVFPHPF